MNESITSIKIRRYNDPPGYMELQLIMTILPDGAVRFGAGWLLECICEQNSLRELALRVLTATGGIPLPACQDAVARLNFAESRMAQLTEALRKAKSRYSRDHGIPSPSPAFPIEVVFSTADWQKVQGLLTEAEPVKREEPSHER